jgi:predicted HD phosphohydrolase
VSKARHGCSRRGNRARRARYRCLPNRSWSPPARSADDVGEDAGDRVEDERGAGNLAYTSRTIRPHTDNPYRDPAPTVQLLHCLRAAGQGGETGLVDGFAAAAAFRAAEAESFATLARTPVSFGYVDKETELRASLPLIQLSSRGRVRGIRFNNRSMRPLRRPYAEVTAFYTAYRRWAELLARPERQLSLRLAPGDCLVFDNTRVLHARTAPLVAAALLHDVGHLRGETDARHGTGGAHWLSQWFGPAVTEPVRLHVAAKRYLCAAEPGYSGLLSPESVRTLAVQGGPMTPEQAAAFEALPYARDAVAVRRWDDEAKDPEVTPPGFDHFKPLLGTLLSS